MHFGRSVVSSFPLFMPVRTLIVDEEHRTRKRVREFLEYTDETEVVGEFGSAVEALESGDGDALDLLFLAVKPPELTVLRSLQALGDRCPRIIFATPSYAGKLQRALAIHGLDYLRKPFTDEQFYDALRRSCRRVLQERLGRTKTTHVRITALLAEPGAGAPSHPDGLVVPEQESGMFRVIRSHDIDWIEAKDRGVQIHAGTETFWLRKTLAEIERQLDPDVFLRIYRSHIVNRTRITAVKRLWKGEYSVILANGTSLGTGRSYQRVVEGFLRTPGIPGEMSRMGTGA